MIPRGVTLVGAGALVGGLAVGALGLHQRAQERARDAATIASYRQTIAALTRHAARLDTVYVARTVERVRTRERWDTVRTGVAGVDTLVHRDTLRLVVAAADSAIAACGLTVATCEERTTALRAILAADTTAIGGLSRRLARAKVRSRLACAVGPSATVVGGTVRVGYVGVSCGLRLF